MFKQLHFRLTAFCTFVTGLLLIVMTGICLYILQADASRQSFLSFEKNVASMISYFENQSVLAHGWLREFENNYHFLISVFDGERPLFFNSLDGSKEKKKLFEMAAEQASREFEMTASTELAGNVRQTESVFFTLKADQKYYASAASLPKEDTSLYIITLYSLQGEQALLSQQRLLFLLVDLGAVALLAVFFWFFTGHMLSPIEESRLRQAQFVADASHELRSPLTVILSSLSAMRKAPEEKRQQFEEHIQAEGQRMNRLIGDMLVLANADSRRWSFSPSEVEPDTLLLNVYERYLFRAAEKKIRLDIQIPESAAAPQKWDGDRIIQVLEILIDNALSYTPEGGQVRLILSQSREGIQYQVIDNGPGIPENQKRAIFQRFYRGDSSHHDKKHFGLGLCIAEEILRMHKGKIHVEDAAGGGAAFIVSL